MNQPAQWREWKLNGLKITQLRFDYQVHVHMWSAERDLLVIFGIPFTFRTAEGITVVCDYEQSQTLCPLLSLRFRAVSVFRASSEGQCQIGFEDGAELLCSPDERYEAWESHGSGDLAGASLLCGPGGGLPWG